MRRSANHMGDLKSIVVNLLRAVLWQSGKEVGEWSGAPHLECWGAGEDGLAIYSRLLTCGRD
jgi:hypothetical protein